MDNCVKRLKKDQISRQLSNEDIMSDLKPINPQLSHQNKLLSTISGTGTSIPYLHVPGDNFFKNFYVYFIL